MHVSIYQQDCHGVEQFRVQRDDGRLIFNAHQVDFPTEDEAIEAVKGEARRTRQNLKLRLVRHDNQANGRRLEPVTQDHPYGETS